MIYYVSQERSIQLLSLTFCRLIGKKGGRFIEKKSLDLLSRFKMYPVKRTVEKKVSQE